jgi:hypothetical protein
MVIDFDKFKITTGYDMVVFLNRYSSFMDIYYPSVVNYYSGGGLNQNAFFELDYLLKEVSKIEPLFLLNTNRMDTIDMWELLDLFTDVQTKLLTIKNTGKWMRSSRLNTNDTGVKIDRVQYQNETVEMMANDLGYGDPHNDWMDIAINNQAIEEDYTLEGGKIFTVVFQNNSNIGLDNIVDFGVGKNILGKDVIKKISFVNNDLETVEYEKAMAQSFEVKMNVQKNSIPEFPEYGINNQYIGTSIGALSYPSLFRDVLALFRQDKRWTKVNLLDLYHKDDMVFMKIEATSILKDSLVTNINV